MQERQAALLAAFDREAEWVTTQAEEAIPAAQAELAKLAGSDPFDSLNPEEQARAAARRGVVEQDCEMQRPDELVTRARAALAANDKAVLYLLGRYIGMRLDREPGRVAPELRAVHRQITERFADPKLGEKRHTAERRVAMAKLLGGRIDLARRQLDGRHDAMLADMRRRIAL